MQWVLSELKVAWNMIHLVYMLETLHPSITAGYICSLDLILLFSESIIIFVSSMKITV